MRAQLLQTYLRNEANKTSILTVDELPVVETCFHGYFQEWKDVAMRDNDYTIVPLEKIGFTLWYEGLPYMEVRIQEI